MKYDDLIGTLEACQTPRIRAIAFPSSCSSERLPDAFRTLLPNIVKILDANIEWLCSKTEVAALFNLQHLSFNLVSEMPRILRRITDRVYPTQHLCCVLEYLAVSADQLNCIVSWQNAKSIIIDFTTGLLMNDEYYCHRLFGTKPAGMIYGTLNQRKLQHAWKTIHSVKQVVQHNVNTRSEPLIQQLSIGVY